jgi:hypothetical protein
METSTTAEYTFNNSVLDHVQAPCKSCGHCPTCGSGGNSYRAYPYSSPWYVGDYFPITWPYVYSETVTASNTTPNTDFYS